MNCPNCIEKLTPTDASGVQTYTCKSCNGIWIPERSLATLLKIEKIDLTIRDLVLKEDGTEESTRNCASCKTKKLNLVVSHGVKLDVCVKCYGLFFDQNEINKVLPKTHQPQSNDGTLAQTALFALLSLL